MASCPSLLEVAHFVEASTQPEKSQEAEEENIVKYEYNYYFS